MIRNQQKMLLHVYKDAAGLSEPAYRDQLKHAAGVPSAADPQMSQSGYERAMAALETVLFLRVHSGQVPNPIGRSRWIQSEFYWRRKIPATGRINSRQAYLIEKLWSALQPHLPQDQQNPGYLAAITTKATGKTDYGKTAFSSAEADALINALKDRLAHAIAGKDA